MSTCSGTLLQAIEEINEQKVKAIFSMGGGRKSSVFKLTMGSGQGDPLSTFRYIILHHVFVTILDIFNAQSQGLRLPDKSAERPTLLILPCLCLKMILFYS